MAASVEYRQEEMSSRKIKETENGDDLPLFVDFNRVNLNLDLLQKSNQIQVAFDSASEYQLKPETKSIIHGQDSGAAKDLLNSMNNITDYDWLLSPPRHSAPSLEIEEQITLADHTLVSNAQSTSLEPKLENPTADVTLTTNISSSNGVKPARTKKAPSTGPTKSTGPIKRSTTPTTRPPILVKSAPRSLTPIQRPSVTVTASAKSASRSSTPTQRPSVTVAASAKSASRSSTPTQRPSATVSAKSASRSSTPAQRPSVTVSAKSASRSSTPTQRASVTAFAKSASRSSTPTQRPSSAKSATRSSTPTVTASAKSASRSSTPTQTASAKSASRSSTPTLRSSNASSGGVKSGVTKGRGYSNGDDDVNPVLMGTQMVERVVNMRKLAPPREDRVSDQDSASGKLSVSQINSGFGRSLSKKSFDMALRHLDIRRSMPGNMRASITKVPASSVYSVRPESTKSRTISASESPLATSSSASSEDIHTTNH